METPLTQNIRPAKTMLSIREYENQGGYSALQKAVTSMTPQEVRNLVTESGLRGRGGAGFPTGSKWSFMPVGPGAPTPKYVIMNADEMEPGTFKDRLLLEGDPHGAVEAILLAAYAVEAEYAFIFLRGEYTTAIQTVTKAIEAANASGYIGTNARGQGKSVDVRLHVSAGRYICGEETALLNALEGGRAQPRNKPPYPHVSGLFGKPTVINNVETLYNLRHIVKRGAAWFQSLGLNNEAGTKLYGVSGNVNTPGIWELPMGTTPRALIEKHANGMRQGLRLRGFLPGGASTDFLTEEHLDVPLTFDAMQKAGSRLGTGTMIILDDKTCPVGMVHNLIAFFARESCGWCTPCRDGLPWIRSILEAIEAGDGRSEDLQQLSRFCSGLSMGRTFCALAPGAMEPLQSALKYFRSDFERHIAEKQCSYTK